MEMMETGELRRYLLISVVVLFWLLTPLYLQMRYGYSAIKISFTITVIYYIGFRIWKWKNPDHKQP